MRRRGFTLIELSIVLAVIGVLVSLSVPLVLRTVFSARTEEARAVLFAVAHAELRYHRDHHAYLSCPAEGAVPTEPVPFPAATACWKALGIDVGGPVRYRYQVQVDGESFAAIAEGDLDADGVTSRFEVPSVDLQLRTREPLE